MKSSPESSTTVLPDSVPLMKVAAVARRLNVSVSTVYSLVEAGKLEHFRCPGVRVSEEQLAAYLASTRRSQIAAPAESMTPRPQLLFDRTRAGQGKAQGRDCARKS
jgi:excisionase family DNA binding protein